VKRWLRALGVGLALGPAALVTQTIAYAVTPWETSLFGFRYVFAGLDAVLVVPLVMLARCAPERRVAAWLGAILAALVAITDVASPSSEPSLSLGVAALALATLPADRGRTARKIAIAFVSISALGHVIAFFGGSPSDASLAWISFGIDLARPLSVALAAFAAARTEPLATTNEAAGPYRAPAPSPPPSVRVEPALASLSEETRATLGYGGPALARHYVALLVRFALVVASGLALAAFDNSDSMQFFSILPFAALAADVVLLDSFARIAAFPLTKALPVLGILTTGILVLCDLGCCYSALSAIGHPWRASDGIGMSAIAGGLFLPLAVVFAGSALGRLGPGLGTKARGVRAIAVVLVASAFGALGTVGNDHGPPALLLFATLASWIALLVAHVRLVRAVRAALPDA
jgi:hypothetical protein